MRTALFPRVGFHCPSLRAVSLLLLFWPAAMKVAPAQPLQGGAQSSSAAGTDIFALYAGRDQLGGEPQNTPTTIGPKGNVCIASDPKWILVAQIGDTCYWYAPLPKRLNGYVVPLSLIASVESHGGRCGVNPFSNPYDPNGTAICDQQPPKQKPSKPGLNRDPAMPLKSGCNTQGQFIPNCYYIGAGRPTSQPTDNGPYCFYQDVWGNRTSPPVLCPERAWGPRKPSPLPWEQPVWAGPTSQPQDFTLMTGRYQGHTRGYDNTTLVYTRFLTITEDRGNASGAILHDEKSGVDYHLVRTGAGFANDPYSATYSNPTTTLPNGTETHSRPMQMMLLKQSWDTRLPIHYDAYFYQQGSNPPLTPSETWMRTFQ